MNSVRAKLDRMGRPRFRLSCREADWFGANDSDHLKSVAPDGAVTVLRLEPLSGQDVRQILLANLGIDDPENFIASAQGRGLQGLLANPHSLEMLAVAVGSDRVWPNTRMQAFDMACRTLLVEHNEDHRIAQPDSGGVFDLMNAGGRLCAIRLLTGAAGYSRVRQGKRPGSPWTRPSTGRRSGDTSQLPAEQAIRNPEAAPGGSSSPPDRGVSRRQIFG